MNYPYETLDYVGRVVFKDAYGLEAEYHTVQRIRVLAPELFAITERFWGWGDPVQDFVAPAASSVALVQKADPPAIVMVLKRPAKAGDEVEIHSSRRIYHAFKADHGIWEYRPFTPTARVHLSFDFPVGRDPEGISVSTSPGARSPYVRRPGTKELLFTIRAASPGSLYRADWDW